MSSDGTRQIANAFMKLPSKRDYGHYYKVIKAPISLKMIYDRIANYVYPEMFKDDFQRMIANAKIYNQEGSPIYQDALILEVCFGCSPHSLVRKSLMMNTPYILHIMFLPHQTP